MADSMTLLLTPFRVSRRVVPSCIQCLLLLPSTLGRWYTSVSWGGGGAGILPTNSTLSTNNTHTRKQNDHAVTVIALYSIAGPGTTNGGAKPNLINLTNVDLPDGTLAQHIDGPTMGTLNGDDRDAKSPKCNDFPTVAGGTATWFT